MLKQMRYKWIKHLIQSNFSIQQSIVIHSCPIFIKSNRFKQQNNPEICKNIKSTNMFGKGKNSWLRRRSKRKAQFWWIIISNLSMFTQIKIRLMWSIILLYIIGKWAYEIIIRYYRDTLKVILSKKSKKKSCCSYEKVSER